VSAVPGADESKGGALHRISEETADFPAQKTLESYDFAFATGARRAQIQELASLEFVERAENIVPLGPSGTVRSTLPSPSGSSPRTMGWEVRFISAY